MLVSEALLPTNCTSLAIYGFISESLDEPWNPLTQKI